MDEMDSPRQRTRVPHVPELPIVTRVLLIVFGWLLVLVGIVGLVLPGLQGVLTILLGGAVLSLTSRAMLRALRWCFRPWPKGWKRMLSARSRVLDWLSKGHDES